MKIPVARVRDTTQDTVSSRYHFCCARLKVLDNSSSHLTGGVNVSVPIVLALITLLWIGLMAKLTPLAIRKDANCHFLLGQGALLTIELARNKDDLNSALSCKAGMPNVIEQVNRNTQLDCVFIALYALSTWSVAALLRGISARPLIALVFVGSALIAIGALCDYAENYNIFQMLHAASAGRLTDALAVAIHRPSLLKWATLGAGWLLTGVALLLGGGLLDTTGKSVIAWIFGAATVFLGGVCVYRVWAWLHLPGARF